MKVLREWLAFDCNAETIKESREKNSGNIILKGILQKADAVNQNGRIYPKAIIEREIRNYQKFINEKRAIGECDHPDSSVVELKNASHIIEEAHMDGSTVYGTVRLLNTPAGKILQNLIEDGVKLGISSRGVGSTKKEGDYQMVQEDYQLICWDFVAEPSVPGAFMMTEGKVSYDQLKKVFNKTDRIDRVLNDILYLNKR